MEAVTDEPSPGCLKSDGPDGWNVRVVAGYWAAGGGSVSASAAGTSTTGLSRRAPPAGA